MPGRNPHSILEESIKELYGGSVPGDIPKRWEKFSDVAIFPQGSFEGDEWSSDEALWEVVADALGANRVARMGEVSGEFRKPSVELLLGDTDWVVRKENGISYGYSMQSQMFSKGNFSERERMGEVVQEGEVVVDLFAGIGYYSIPALVHGRARLVHSCEWNPSALSSLRWNLEENGVEDRCVIHEGDCRITTESLAGVADRVFLGLLPSSEDGLEPAMRVLSPSGGTLHVHGAPPGDLDSWVEGLFSSISPLRPGSELSSTLVRVNSYEPRVWRVVADILVA